MRLSKYEEQGSAWWGVGGGGGGCGGGGLWGVFQIKIEGSRVG